MVPKFGSRKMPLPDWVPIPTLAEVDSISIDGIACGSAAAVWAIAAGASASTANSEPSAGVNVGMRITVFPSMCERLGGNAGVAASAETARTAAAVRYLFKGNAI